MKHLLANFSIQSIDMKNAIVLSATLIAFLFTSCKTTESVTAVEPDKSTPTTVGPEKKTLSDAAVIGRSLYQEHCDKCHALPAVGDYSEKKWSHIVPDMCNKAELDAAQEQSIMTYVMEQLQLGDRN